MSTESCFFMCAFIFSFSSDDKSLNDINSCLTTLLLFNDKEQFETTYNDLVASLYSEYNVESIEFLFFRRYFH